MFHVPTRFARNSGAGLQKINVLLAILALIAAAGGFTYLKRQDIRHAIFRIEQGPIPAPVTRNEFLKAGEPEPITAPKTEKEKIQAVNEPEPARPDYTTTRLPDSINLSVLFIPQAPFQVWDAVHEETCEEASLAMLKAYYDGTKSMSLEEMDARLFEIIEHEKSAFGYFESTDAARTASVMKNLYGLDAKVIPIESIDDIKREISAGRPVLLPTSGKALMNPNFKNGGPEYHMVVAKGYTRTRIITNDPGTRNGSEYTYAYETLWNAIGDWDGSGTDTSIKLMIVVE